jgi:uncharacterized protein
MVAALALLGVSAFATKVAWSSYRAEAAVFAARRWEVPKPDLGAELAALREVTIDSPPGRLAGWYLPSRNRAAVVLCHGSSSDRTSLLPDARLLQRAGYGVLLYDSPGHGESEGEVHWGEPEVAALRAAVGFVSGQPDVDASRVGALGFSMGGYVVALGAADDARIAAAVLEGTPSDGRRHLRYEYRGWGPLSYVPASWAAQRCGFDLDGPTPERTVSRIAPRPVLIVTGTADPVVPPAMTDELFAAAREPKRLLRIANAGHGGYTDAPGSTYTESVLAFFEQALLRQR